jgi:hypothetical protein
LKKGEGKHLTLLHLYTNYRITEKPIKDMTLLQYNATLKIAEEIMKYKQDNKPIAVI